MRCIVESLFTVIMPLAMGMAADAAANEWKPVAQPNLAAALDAAPPLAFEELADGPDSCWQGPLWWMPNPDGKTWDFVFIYYKSYSGPNEAFIYDTGTKQVTKARCPELATVPFGFHMNRPLLFGGKGYLVSGAGGPGVFVYDPATNEFTYGGEPLGAEGERVVRGGEGTVTPNDDGTRIAGFGPLAVDRDRSRVGFFTIDPTTLAGEFLGEVGPPNPNYQWEYRSVVTDGDWIYGRVGHTPWRLLGMNVKTREGKVIAETERFVGDRYTIRFQRHPDYPGVHVTITGLKGGSKDKTQAFWLLDGTLTPCEPAPKNAAPLPPAGVAKLAQPRAARVVAFSANDPPPKGLQIFRGALDLEGRAVCWFRFTDAAMAAANGVETNAWQRIELPPVTLYPSTINRLAALENGSLFALTNGYGRAVTFDPKSKKRTSLGETMSVYSLLPFERKLYLCGYSGSMVWIYDPAQPWTAGKSLDAPPVDPAATREEKATRDTNPAHVATLKEFTDVHMPWAAAAGADGRIYFGGKVVRIGNGGGLGWWDTKKNEGGGIHDPFEMFPIYWMCSAAEGRSILCSTKAVAAADNPDVVPPRGKLFVYDTTTQEIVHQVDDERLAPYPGFITEALPGLVMGYTVAKDAAGIESGLLYGFDPAAGKVLWTKPVPRPPATGFSAIKNGRQCFTTGPDGFIWAAMGGVLARIDPRTAEVLPVGTMDDAPIAFLDGDVYVGGSKNFRRIKGIPKVTPLTVPSKL
ncbi:MAG: hypothetical protein K8S94_11185 [Planctomycetia bacterium]|nr:hypothetical protein [Planctomycetia bacterium]